MDEILLHPRVVTLGLPGFDVVGDERTAAHAWLAAALVGAPCRLQKFERTNYLQYDDMVDDPGSLSDILDATNVNSITGPSVLMLDFSGNDYSIIREPVLFDLARAMTAWSSGETNRTGVVMLPSFPSDRSLLWSGLEGTHASGTIYVVASDGRVRRFGASVSELPDGFAREYGEIQAALWGSVEARIRRRTLRKLGHFKITDGEEIHCGRYFFDASLAVNEITRALVERVRQNPLDGKAVVLTHGGNSDWLHEAGMAVALELGGRRANITHVTDFKNVVRSDEVAIVVFDVIGTGTTAAGVIRMLKKQAVPFAGTVHAVMIDEKTAFDPSSLGVFVSTLVTVSSGKTSREECEQHRVQLPYTPSAYELHTKIRAYDAWEMMLGNEWISETFPESEPKLFSTHPDMGVMLSTYGDWIAYKVEMLLQRFGIINELVVVAPNESHANRMIERLAERFDQRLVAVRIPRAAIDDPPTPPSTKDDLPVWEHHLRHIAATKPKSVVILDEMNASGRTAASMIRILKARGVTPSIYVPIVDRRPRPWIEGVQVEPLYVVPSPR